MINSEGNLREFDILQYTMHFHCLELSKSACIDKIILVSNFIPWKSARKQQMIFFEFRILLWL